MPTARYLRGFTVFDVLGVFVPGVVTLTGLLLLRADPPAPSAAWEYLLFAIAAFSIGHLVQAYASKATGDRKTFENTLDDARRPTDDSERSSTTGDEEGASTGDDGQADGDSGEDGDAVDASDGDDEPGVVVRGATHLYPVLGPLVWPWWSPQDEPVGSPTLASYVLRDLRKTYSIRRGSSAYDEMLHMISSELDDVESPSRAYRFQAIRNFHRGMWISVWVVSLAIALGWAFDASTGCVLFDARVCDPYLFGQQPLLWQTVVLLPGSMLAFWWLSVKYQREFVEYLIADYFVRLDTPADGESTAASRRPSQVRARRVRRRERRDR